MPLTEAETNLLLFLEREQEMKRLRAEEEERHRVEMARIYDGWVNFGSKPGSKQFEDLAAALRELRSDKDREEKLLELQEKERKEKECIQPRKR